MQTLTHLDRAQAVALLLISPPCLWLIYRLCSSTISSGTGGRSKLALASSSDDPLTSDPSLLRKHSVVVDIHVQQSDYHYPAIRVFHSLHPQASKLPTLPLLVFIHGLGGSVAQFHPLITSLSNQAPCLAIDFPGCGRSTFAPRYWDAYSTNSLIKLIIQLINANRDPDQEIVLICHSMGCSIGALLASTSSPYYDQLGNFIRGLITLCPPGKQITERQNQSIRWLLNIPDPIFDLWRAWDRIGGINSLSVSRFVGPNAEESLKKQQLRFNNQSRSPVFKRMAYGALPKKSSADTYVKGAFVGKQIWSGVKIPTLIIAGENDPVTSSSEAEVIARYLGHSGIRDSYHEEVQASLHSPLTHPVDSTKVSNVVTPRISGLPIKLVVFPSPASHALLYSPRLIRPISNLITHFLSTHVNLTLSPAWQLTHLATEGKWDVKNLAKWKAVKPVSSPIAGIFRAMKTLREVDDITTQDEKKEEAEEVEQQQRQQQQQQQQQQHHHIKHTPAVFAQQWAEGNGADGSGRVIAVIDISHDIPVYDPRGLERTGIVYRKCPSVSKLPPTRDEVRLFFEVVDGLRSTLVEQNREECQQKQQQQQEQEKQQEPQHNKLIAVHCHYGFNRTGFFIVSYLIEKLGWTLKDAVDEFEKARPPGIRHSYFVDELWGRYWDWEDDRRKLEKSIC